MALLTVAVFAVYCRALNSPFVFDDSVSVIDNRSITRLWPLVGDAAHPGPFNPSFQYPTSGRPLVNLSLAINYYFGRLNPVGYRIFNLIVHLLSAVLLMMIVRRTLQLDYFGGRFDRASGPLALVVALLWSIHPLNTETLVYITQRTELMVGFFYLATLYGALRYWSAASTGGRTAWLALSTLTCLAGALCKEVMVTAPVIVLLYERTFIAGSFRRALRNSWPLYVGLLISWGLLLYLNHAGPRSNTAGFHLGVPACVWWFSQAKVLLMYLRLAVWPWPLAIHYEIPYLTTLSAAWPWLAPVALLGLVTLMLLARRSAIGFVGAWVLLILSPTLIVPITTEIAAERRMYLPLAALATLFVVDGNWLVQQTAVPVAAAAASKPARRWSVVLAGAVALIVISILSVVSVRRLAAYDSALSLWEDNVKHQPDNTLAHNMLGNAFFRTGRAADAVVQYRLALQLRPDNSGAHANLGIALVSLGRPEEGLEHYQQALQIDPGCLDALANMALAYAALKRPRRPSL